MLDKIGKLISDTLSLTRDVAEIRRDVDKLRGDLDRLTEKVSQLAFDLQRERERARYERDLQERTFENLLLRLELALEKSGRQMPPSSSDEPKQLP